MNENSFAFFAPPISTPPGHTTTKRTTTAMKREGDLNLEQRIYVFLSTTNDLPATHMTSQSPSSSDSVPDDCACVCSFRFVSQHHPHSFRSRSEDFELRKIFQPKEAQPYRISFHIFADKSFVIVYLCMFCKFLTTVTWILFLNFIFQLLYHFTLLTHLHTQLLPENIRLSRMM